MKTAVRISVLPIVLYTYGCDVMYFNFACFRGGAVPTHLKKRLWASADILGYGYVRTIIRMLVGLSSSYCRTIQIALLHISWLVMHCLCIVVACLQ